MKPVEIICSACGKETILLRSPKFDGFTKVGEELQCSSCDFVYESEEEVPFKEQDRVEVFSDKDRPAAIHLFDDGEASTLCRLCNNYVVNPFMQWCSHHKKEVEATDTCNSFAPREEEPTL